MKNQLTTSATLNVIEGKHVAKKCIVHTATSCGLIDNVFAVIEGNQAIITGNLIIEMHKAIQNAKAFISGFEDDETQTGIRQLIEQLSQFDIK